MHASAPILPIVTYELSFDGSSDTYWKVVNVWIHEAINRPTQATINACIEAEAETDVDVDAMLGADVALEFFRGTLDPQFLYGIVARIEVLGFTDKLLSLRFHISTAFGLLQQVTHSKIWQDCSPLDIVKEVLTVELAAYGRSFDAGSVNRGTTTREYCVQYGESMFAFVARLLEEEGISYSFTHAPDTGVELLTLVDANDQYKPLATVDGSETLPHVPDQPEFIEFESVQEMDRVRSLTGTAVLRRDFDWRRPESLCSAELSGTDARGRTRRHYCHTLRRFSTNDLSERTSDMLAALALPGAVFDGVSNATALRAGASFTLSGHDNEAHNQRYIVTSVRHSGAPGSGNQYVNDFDCVLANVEIRPPQITPKPRVLGPQTAIVTGEDEIHTDEHGRIRVQFAWEESPIYSAGSSCWIRCMQSWSGGGWGAQFIPRVGMEVVVEFLEGNPDRPMVVGCVYDGSREYPFHVPDTKTQSGWRTRSSPGSEGFNELRFEDAAGTEEIYVHAQRNLRTQILAEESRSVGGGRVTQIVANDDLTVSEGDVSITIEKGSRTLKLAQGGDSVTLGKGGSSRSMPNGTSALEAKEISLTAADKLTLSCGGSTIEMTAAQVEIKSPMIKLN